MHVAAAALCSKSSPICAVLSAASRLLPLLVQAVLALHVASDPWQRREMKQQS